ncbi:hypothetical protein QP027_10445 [Corynebacterium breve]|uniref:SLATT domain-containing protein n=1 Tax=Corynebacterium breve TaxID=3049799 RepID=A0ABY8VIW9_9CORY|nr:hypothetical protein [Corynebacterium breve]WIM67505.1 hypothetical protein QP027_10445 [Corynebacterium breve]
MAMLDVAIVVLEGRNIRGLANDVHELRLSRLLTNSEADQTATAQRMQEVSARLVNIDEPIRWHDYAWVAGLFGILGFSVPGAAGLLLGATAVVFLLFAYGAINREHEYGQLKFHVTALADEIFADMESVEKQRKNPRLSEQIETFRDYYSEAETLAGQVSILTRMEQAVPFRV